MKKCTLIVFLFACTCCVAQNLSNDSISVYSLNQIFNELKIPDKYTSADCEGFGQTLAAFDYAHGNKRILQFTGMFTTGCKTCLYAKYGYSSYDFAPVDIKWDNVDAFADAYNNLMISHLPADAQIEIHKPEPPYETIFSNVSTASVTPEIKWQTDSTINLCLHSDTLESLFKENIDSLLFQYGYQSLQMESAEYSYSEIKNHGVTLQKNQQDILKIYILLDFRKVPANYDICWCPELATRYWIMLPVKLK